MEEIIDSDDYNSDDVIYQTQICNVISPTSTIFMREKNQSSSEIQSLDAKPRSSSELEDKLLSACPDMKDESTKDMNLICPSVTKSSEIESEVSLAEENAEDVHHICPSSMNPLANVAEANNVDLHRICPSSTNTLLNVKWRQQRS